ncbi:Clp protease N-terminal domain-containing protein [Streptomyces sp. NPDC048290]|uniref:Clp protease N-terminal domain-containing protein n=1 Tax=Streptomyces sp. NPDC048290 TaxID=3155811 RepID=UPI00343292AF
MSRDRWNPGCEQAGGAAALRAQGRAPGALDAAAYERFTPRAQAVLTASEEEARAAGHAYLGTEHVVLGLLSQPDGLAAQYLLGKTTPERLRAEMKPWVMRPEVMRAEMPRPMA